METLQERRSILESGIDEAIGLLEEGWIMKHETGKSTRSVTTEVLAVLRVALAESDADEV